MKNTHYYILKGKCLWYLIYTSVKLLCIKHISNYITIITKIVEMYLTYFAEAGRAGNIGLFFRWYHVSVVQDSKSPTRDHKCLWFRLIVILMYN